MPRVRFNDLAGRTGERHELVIPRPDAQAAGYTPIMLLTEWLTLNCHGDWASRALRKCVVVRFASESDYARAAAQLAAEMRA